MASTSEGVRPSFGETLAGVARTIRSRPWACAALALPAAALAAVGSVALTVGQDALIGDPGGPLAAQVVLSAAGLAGVGTLVLTNVVVQPVVFVGLSRLSGAELLADGSDVDEATGRAMDTGPRAVAAVLLTLLAGGAVPAAVATVAALALLVSVEAAVVLGALAVATVVFPGLYVLLRLSLAVPVLAFEDLSASEALRRSWELTGGGFWWVVGILLVAGLTGLVLGTLVGAPFAAAGVSDVGAAVVFGVGEVLAGLVQVILTGVASAQRTPRGGSRRTRSGAGRSLRPSGRSRTRPPDGEPRCMRSIACCVVLLATLLAPGAGSARTLQVHDGDAYVEITDDGARIGNALVERAFAWDPDRFRTMSLRDKRTGREWVQPGGSNAFAFSTGPVSWTSEEWTPVRNSVSASTMPRGGVVLRMRLENAAAPFTLTRRVEVLPGVAGFATRTTVSAPAGFVFDRYTLDEVTTDVQGVVPHGVDMRGGADWRDETDYDYRADVTPDADGETAQWMDVTAPAGDGFALLMERRNYHSSVMTFDGARGTAAVDTSRDLQYLGPLEPGTAGVNPTGVPRYVRKVPPAGSLELEPAFLALSTDPDDAPWQAYRYLRHRMRWDGPTVDFNTNNVDDGDAGRGSGAKDDADFPTVMELLPITERMGIEVFVLDDGWMPRNGDWVPDPDRFPDGFEPLLAELDDRGMRLGLWMAPANFHPETRTFHENPEWQCAPIGTATAAQNALDPEGDGDLSLFGGSNEPGVGVWNMAGVNRHGEVFADRLRADIDRLVNDYDVAKFKFDFLVWIDCASPEPVDVYQYHDAFFGRVVDSLVDEHPDVGFGVDETNDYRAFPYESVLRGPTWFQNGSPDPDALLHTVWTLAPYVPGFSLGMHVLGGSSTAHYPTDYLVAVSFLYQPTVWSDVRDFVRADGTSKLDVAGEPIVETAREWFDFYKARRDELATFTYPLLTDPLGSQGWAAFQPWDRDAQSGFLLAYRQDTAETSVTVPLRGVDPDATFRLTDEVTAAVVGEYTGAELLAGIDVSAPERFDFRVIRITPLD